MPKDTSKVIYTTSLNSDLLKRFRIYCSIKGKYQNEVLEQLIEKFLQEEGETTNQLIEELIKKEAKGNGDTNK